MRQRSGSVHWMAAAIGAGAAATCALGCGAPGDDKAERIDSVEQALDAYCTIDVKQVGTLDLETEYLPNVVRCENGGAPFESLKAQAIAARTYAYYKIKTSGAVSDGTGDQVYSCGGEAKAIHKEAVQQTAGQVLRHDGLTLCAFYVAGDSTLSAPGCKGQDGDASTEKFVTYNEGKTGDEVEPTTLGSLSNPHNRGCMSQWGSRCLADTGKDAKAILEFYYGADVQIVTATGSCVAGGGGAGQGGGPGDGGAGGAVTQGGDDPDPDPIIEPFSNESNPSDDADAHAADASCSTRSIGARGQLPWALALATLGLFLRRRRRPPFAC